jgi:hypothetical protein
MMAGDVKYMPDSMLGPAAIYSRGLLDATLLKVKGPKKEVLV